MLLNTKFIQLLESLDIVNPNESRQTIKKMIEELRDLVFNTLSKEVPLTSASTQLDPFAAILGEMYSLYKSKNADYGNSFGDTIQKFGYPTAIARIHDKYNRVEKMVLGEKMNIKESLRDNLIDIANYCILTVIELDKDLKNKDNV